MSASPAKVLAAAFVQAGLAAPSDPAPAAGAWAVVTGGLPAEEARDNFISVSDNGAWTQGRLQRPGTRVVHPRVVIDLRGTSYDTTYAKAKAVEDYLDGIGKSPSEGGSGPVTVSAGGGSRTVLAAHVTVPATKIGQDAKRRPIFVVNAMLTLGD